MCMQPGVTTDEIDKAVHKMIVDNGAYPSPLTYGESCNPNMTLNARLHTGKATVGHLHCYRACLLLRCIAICACTALA